ncbi:MAG: hypothetical protein CFE44_28540 [Burkholderiales bacterium PBB4]|nr:MAG: hypothetical protein CFE44_28540 [Burkholderiales bacterium PBB4]
MSVSLSAAQPTRADESPGATLGLGYAHTIDAGHSLTQVWLRDALGRAMDFASLAAISDAFFPRLFLRRARFVPVGTVSMTIYFHAQAEQLAKVGGGFILGQAQGQHFQNGFFDQSAQLWSQTGEMLVTTHQTVYYKE